MDGRDFLIVFGSIFTAIGLIIGGAIWLDNTVAEGRCRNTAETMGVEYRYSMNMPCMVKANGQFVPLSAFKVLQ
jgi:hypothetical protein